MECSRVFTWGKATLNVFGRTQRFKATSQRFFSVQSSSCDYGILCDVDGVLTRGRSPISSAFRAFELLRDHEEHWTAPVLFLTNASNVLKQAKATELSNVLKCQISPQDIVMSHTPLRQYSELFDKHVAICGLGPIKEIAHNLGFKNVSTIEEISAAFPFLDACKPKEEMHTGPIAPPNLDKIEAIILFGEPQRWERSLQILLDVLIHDGDPSKNLEDCGSDYHSHLPVFACSSDLVWAGEAPTPRLAHGSFLICLESLYERMTGHRLQYTSLVGKPSPVTYTFALSQLNAIAAKEFGATQPLRRVYCIGDNVDVDVYGANLYNLCLKTLTSEAFRKVSRRVHSFIREEHPNLTSMPFNDPVLPEEAEQRSLYDTLIERSSTMPTILQQLADHTHLEESVCSFFSTLVLTGVYQEHQKMRVKWPDLLKPVKEIHPNLPHLPNLRVPNFVARDVEEAIKYILFLEGGLKEPVQVTRSCPYLDDDNDYQN